MSGCASSADQWQRGDLAGPVRQRFRCRGRPDEKRARYQHVIFLGGTICGRPGQMQLRCRFSACGASISLRN